MKKILLLAALLPALAFGHGAPVIWNGTSAKWLPSGLNSAGVCKLSSSGVMSSSTVSDSELATSYVKADGTRALTGSWNVGAFDITASTFIGALTGNASTASALASNPSDCAAGTKATAIDASGNLTCSASSLTADVSGILPLENGGTSKSIAVAPGGLVYTDTDSMEVGAAGTAGQAAISGGTGAPTWYAPTLGSVLFAGTGGILAQDNSNFFWDDTNDRLGIGINSSLTSRLSLKAPSTSSASLSLISSGGAEYKFMHGLSSADFWIEQGCCTQFMSLVSGNFSIFGTRVPKWYVQIEKASTQTTLNTFFNSNTGDPVFGVVNSSATANNFSGIAFVGNSTGTTQADSGIYGKHVSHTSSAETGRIGLATRNAGGTMTSGLEVSETQTVTLPAYTTAGVIVNSAAGLLSSVAPSTSGNVLTSNGSAWVSSSLPASTLSAVVKSANYTLTNSDDFIACNPSAGSALTIALPAVASATTKSYNIKNIGAGPCYVAANGFELIEGETSVSLAVTSASISIIPVSGVSQWFVH